MEEMEQQGQHYFWTGWFDGQSFGLLATVFSIFSFVDLLATTQTMDARIVKEGNPIAVFVLKEYGPAGFVAYKVLLVMLIIGVTMIIDRVNPRLARGVLWGGIILMAFITILHLAIMFSGISILNS